MSRPRITRIASGGHDAWGNRWRFDVELPDGHRFTAIATTTPGSATVVDLQAEHGHDDFTAGSTGYPDVDDELRQRLGWLVERDRALRNHHVAGGRRRATQRTTRRRLEQYRRAA